MPCRRHTRTRPSWCTSRGTPRPADADHPERRHGRARDARRERRADQRRLDVGGDRGHRLGSRLPLAGPIRVEDAIPVTRSPSRSSTSRRAAGGGQRSCPASVSCRGFPDPYLRIFDLTTGDVTFLREDIAIPVAPFLGTMGVCPAGATEQPVMPPGLRRQHGYEAADPGTTLYLPVQVEGRSSAAATPMPRRATARSA